MKWVKLPEMEIGTERAHWFAYCWACQNKKFMPGLFLQSQLYFNPFIHTEPICENCAKACDPNFGYGSELRQLEDGSLDVIRGGELECPHKGKKCFYSLLPSSRVVIACSWECAKGTLKRNEEKWNSFCDKVGL